MTEGAPEGGAAEVVELPALGDAAFAGLMDALAPEPEGGDAGKAGDGAAAGGDGAAAAGAGGDAGAAGAGAAGAAGAAAAPAGGAAADPAGDKGAAAGGAAGDAAVSGGGDLPAGWDADAVSFVPKLGQLSTAFEENVQNALRSESLEEVKTEHAKYFEVLNKHPRMLVGQEVPAIGREGMEKLKSSEDAREWQDAVKQLLAEEVQSRASVAFDGKRDFLETVHASIDLFKNNHDLIPGTKTFDVELANRFTSIVQPYELRVDGKLQGYTIPVQPIIEKVRAEIVAQRAAAPTAPPAAGGAAAPPAATPAGEPPQAGIAGKAGSGSSAEDFSTLFGTLGLPDFRI